MKYQYTSRAIQKIGRVAVLNNTETVRLESIDENICLEEGKEYKITIEEL